MMTKEEAIHKALKVLNCLNNDRIYETAWVKDAINACEEALEQPAQEPVKNVTLSCGCKSHYLGFPSEWDEETRECQPCTNYGVLCEKHFEEWAARPVQYTHPHQWQGLTDDEIDAIVVNSETLLAKDIARAIEQALKEKNT